MSPLHDHIRITGHAGLPHPRRQDPREASPALGDLLPHSKIGFCSEKGEKWSEWLNPFTGLGRLPVYVRRGLCSLLHLFPGWVGSR